MDAVYYFLTDYKRGSVKAAGSEPFIGDVLSGVAEYSPATAKAAQGITFNTCQRIMSSLSALAEDQKAILKIQ